MMPTFRETTARSFRRSAGLAGSLLSIVVAAPGYAEEIVVNQTDNYTLNRTSPISGGPRVVDVTTDGSVGITLGDLTATSSVLNGAAVAINDPGSSNVSVSAGNVVASGSGQATGIIITRSFAGSTTINAASVTTSSASSDGIRVASGTATTVNVGSVRATGANSNGIWVSSFFPLGSITITAADVFVTSGRGILANGKDGTTVVARNVSAGGFQGIGIQAYGGPLAVTTTGEIRTTGAVGYGIYLLGTTTTSSLNSGAITTAGDGGVGILSNAGPLLAGDPSVTSIVNTGSITTTGGVTTDGSTTIQANGIWAVTKTGTVTIENRGTISTSGNGASGIVVETGAGVRSFGYTGGAGGAVSVGNSGAITATGANGSGVLVRAGNSATMIDNSGLITGGSGLNLAGGSNVIVNKGTISGAAGAGIIASGTTSFDNAGSIAGSGAVAVQLGATNDTVILRSGSNVAGMIDGGGGADAAILVGTVLTPTASQTVAGFSRFSSLNVKSGYWTAGSTNSGAFASSVTIDAGASLDNINGTTGLSVTAPSIINNGTLVVRSGVGSAGSTFGTSVVTGSGNVQLSGAGTVTLDGMNSIQTTGETTIDSGTTAALTGTQSGKFVINNGGTFAIGNGGTSGIFTGDVVDNGTLVIDHSDDYNFGGALTGTGNLVKQGAGKLTLGTNYAFTGTTTISGGSIKLSGTVNPNTEIDLRGNGQLDFSGTRQTVAELAGSSTGASINIAGGALTVNQTTSTAFVGNITGAGALTKTGDGTLNLTGANTYTGATTVGGGKLAVNGSIVSPVTVTAGGKLVGTGTVANVTIAAGGAYAPGNSIGTQNVAGNVVFAAGSTYEVETNADGRSDRIIATGTATIAANSTLAVLAEAGTYNRLTSYNVLSATGGVTGTFTNLTSNFAFLTPSLSYTGTAVTLRLLRNDVTFASLARTPNQLAVANAISAQGFSGTVFNAAIMLSNAATPNAYNELSGELFAAVPSVLIDQSRRIRGAVLDRAAAQGEGWGIWGQAGRAGIETDATGNVAATATDRTTVLSGVDYGMDEWRVGLHAGYIDSNVGVKGRASQADVHTKLVGAYARWSQDALTVKVGGDYSWHDVDTTRSISIPGLNAQQRAGYDATSQQLFGEVAYTLIDGPVTAAPFGGLAYVRTHSDRVVETGSAAALTVASRTRDIKLATAGWHLGGSAPIGTGATLLPHLTASFQYAWGDLRGGSVAQFGGAGQAFGVSGARLAEATYGLDGGVDVQFGKSVKAGIGGFMSTSRDWSDFGANVSVSFAF